MPEDPWKNLAPPNKADLINARRVDLDIPWNFFWARDLEQRCLLVLEHAANSTPRNRFPKLKGMEVSLSEGNPYGTRMLVFRLQDSAHRDIFYRLCLDITAGTCQATSEKEAVEVALARTWRWHHLLRGGGDGRLSEEEQKGLIGELIVIERYLLPHLSASNAVSSWHGPLGSPKDFEIGRIGIEAKARRGAASPYITISSEYQLDDSGTDTLFLHVVELDQAPADERRGFSLSELVSRIHEKVSSADYSAVGSFESLLSAAGFSFEDDYSDSRWIKGPSRLYEVSGNFPRITGRGLTSGVSKVKYVVSLNECEPFLVEDDALESLLKGGGHGN